MGDIQETKPLATDSPCGFCGNSGRLVVLYRTIDSFGYQYIVGRCSLCRAISLYPRPGKELLARAYDDSYYGVKDEKFSFPLVEKVLDWFRGKRGRQLSAYLSDGDNVLDLGCGNGRFLESLLKTKKINAYGIELPGKSAQRAARIPGIHLKTGVLEKMDFEDSSMKAVTLFHVFEHLPNPAEVLDIIDNILVKNGILMISFPNISSWQSRIFKGKWLHLDPPRHLFFIEPRDFITIMKNRGYSLVKQKYSSVEQNPFGMVQSILNLLTYKREVLFEYMKGNREYTKEYEGIKIRFQKAFFFLSFPLFIFTNLLAASFKKGATVEFVFKKTTK